MHRAGFEPAHPEIVGLKSTALDHSANDAHPAINLILNETLHISKSDYHSATNFRQGSQDCFITTCRCDCSV
jgi:hypothetical protein